MTRAFDPVLSAALRSELERRADAARAGARGTTPTSTTTRRWQVAVTAVVLVLVVIGTVAVLGGVPRRAAPATSALPSQLTFPTPARSAGAVVGHARGTTDEVTGRLTAPVGALQFVIRCQGPGVLSISTSDGSTVSWLPVSNGTRRAPDSDQAACLPDAPHTGSIMISAAGGLERYGRLRYTVRPEGSVVWSITFVDPSRP